MLPGHERESESKRRVRFPGICEDAFRLGVSREHLYRVLTGERKSKSLLKRYTEMKRGLNPFLVEPPAEMQPAEAQPAEVQPEQPATQGSV